MILFCWVDKVGIVLCSLSSPSSLLLLYFFLWLFSLVLQRIVQMRIDVFILAPVRMTFAFFAWIRWTVLHFYATGRTAWVCVPARLVKRLCLGHNKLLLAIHRNTWATLISAVAISAPFVDVWRTSVSHWNVIAACVGIVIYWSSVRLASIWIARFLHQLFLTLDVSISVLDPFMDLTKAPIKLVFTVSCDIPINFGLVNVCWLQPFWHLPESWAFLFILLIWLFTPPLRVDNAINWLWTRTLLRCRAALNMWVFSVADLLSWLLLVAFRGVSSAPARRSFYCDLNCIVLHSRILWLHLRHRSYRRLRFRLFCCQVGSGRFTLVLRFLTSLFPTLFLLRLLVAYNDKFFNRFGCEPT